MTQDQALYLLNSGKNVYLTGAAGSGKTYVLNKFIKDVKKQNKEVGVTASTGIAATHLGGITIHSWAGIGIARDLDPDRIKSIVEKRHVAKRLAGTDVLIIDEISMLDADRLSLVDQVARQVRKNEAPFGGMQVVLCGDFFQLPPIQKHGETPALFAYRSPTWQELNLTVCYLTEQYRQGNDALTEVLNAIRAGDVGQQAREHLLGRRVAENVQGNTRLYCHNVDVNAENARELEQLAGDAKTFYMRSSGVPAVLTALKNGCLAPEVLALKKGAAVMFVRNNFDKGFVNGTLGTVEDFDGEGNPVVRGLDGRKFTGTPETWKVEENGETVASIIQIPLRLAWAITIHKSQGMTLDAAEINLADAFERGMGYVALSRVKSLAGMRLSGFNEMALQVHEDVLDFDKKLRELSDKATAEIPADFMSKARRKKSAKSKHGDKLYSVEEIQKTHPGAYEPWTGEEESRLAMGFRAGMQVAELAVLHGRQIGGISSRLKKLGLL